jgi:uncharacterized membrane protein
MAQILQLVGALLILVPFTLLQTGWWQAQTVAYVLTNLIGSALLAVLALVEAQWGFMLLEACWAAVTGWTAVKLVRSWPRAARGDGAASR